MSKAISSEQGELVFATHNALFESIESSRCDACGRPLAIEAEGEGYGVPGWGAYLWQHGDSLEIENVPLCPSCASAIGMSALARWEIEEEEG